MIEHDNIIYMPNISALGGIETYVYELVKKYHYLDIAVVSDRCDEKQAKRIRKYCKLYIHKNEKIKCKVAIINYDQRIINYINKEAKIYQVIHADYTNKIYDDKPLPNKRITAFIGITKYLTKAMKEYLYPNDIILGYNPLTIDNNDKPIIFVSNTRLHAHKGVDRMKKFIKELDKQNTNWLWFCITNDVGVIDNPNVIFIPNRLDDDKFLYIADYVVLLSDSEACSYTLNKALYRNIPIITTPLPYLDEIGVKHGINSYIMEFDCSNVSEIVKNINKVPKFKFNKMDDIYNKLFTNKKSTYKEELEMKVKVQCIQNFYDMEQSERKVKSLDEFYDKPEEHPHRHVWITSKERAESLVEKGLVKIVEVLDKPKKENKKVPTKNIEKKK